MAFLGYFSWNNSNKKFIAKQLSISHHILIILSGAVITFLIGFYLATYTEAKNANYRFFHNMFLDNCNILSHQKSIGKLAILDYY